MRIGVGTSMSAEVLIELFRVPDELEEESALADVVDDILCDGSGDEVASSAELFTA